MSDTPEITASKPAPGPGKLAELLLKHGVVTAKQIEAARALQAGKPPNLAQALVELGFVTEQTITSFLVKQLKLPHLNLQDYQITPEMLAVLPRELCMQYRLLPIDVLGRNLTLAMVNPLDEEALGAVQQECPNYRLKAFVCTPSDFDRVTRRLFPDRGPGEDATAQMSLSSLGIQGKPRPKPAPEPEHSEPADSVGPVEPPAASPPSADEDATATMLFNTIQPNPVGAAGPLRSSLICLDGWELGREVEITGSEHSLGRSPEANTTINSPMISREHARITRSEEYGQETFMVTDLNSSNGTYVNNVRVTATILRHGDRIMLGDVLFKFVLLDEIEARFHQDVHRLYSIHKGTGLLPAGDWVKGLERTLAEPADSPLAACLIEIDNLPQIIQTRGQIASAIVLSDIGELLERYLEKPDLPGDFGEGRIAVTFPGQPLEAVFPKLEDLRRTVEAHVFNHKQDRFRTTITAGLAVRPHGVESGEFIAGLRAALDGAIAQGRNTVAVGD